MQNNIVLLWRVDDNKSQFWRIQCDKNANRNFWLRTYSQFFLFVCVQIILVNMLSSIVFFFI